MSLAPANGGGMRALVVDDHGLYRSGLSLLLRDECGFDEVREAGSLEEAESILGRDAGFSLALFDLFMPGMAGPGCLAVMRSKNPETKFAVVSASQDRRDIVATVAAGLNGYIPKSLPDNDIAGAVRRILSCQIFLPSHVAQEDAARAPRALHAATLEPPPDLTPRQRDVLEAVRRGLTNKEIARNLAIAEGTVKIHIAGLFAALGVRNRTELAIYQ